MIYGFTTTELAFGITAVGIVLLLGIYAWGRYQDDDADNDPLGGTGAVVVDENDSPEAAADGGHVVEVPQPNIRTARFGTVGKVFQLWRDYKRRKKVGDSGYIQWYLLDETFSKPKYVKPEEKGGGMPEYDYDGTTYFFPRKARLPDQETGMWTVVHVKGDAMPINLDLTGKPTVPPASVKEFLSTRVSSTPPSWLSNLGLPSDPSQIIAYGIGALMVMVGIGSVL